MIRKVIGGTLGRTPFAPGLANRLIGGESLDDALATASDLVDSGCRVGLQRVARTTGTQAAAALTEHMELVRAIVASGLQDSCEVMVEPEEFGADTDDSALEPLAAICDFSSALGVQLMIGATGDVDRTITWLEERANPNDLVGLTLPAARRRSEADCSRLGGRRVRLVKGSFRSATDRGYVQPAEIDKAYVRCAKALLAKEGEPSFATHDTRLVEIVEALASRFGRDRGSFEYAFYLGRLDAERERLVAAGDHVRIQVPYGPDRLRRLVGGFVEQPATISAAVRSLLSSL